MYFETEWKEENRSCRDELRNTCGFRRTDWVTNVEIRKICGKNVIKYNCEKNHKAPLCLYFRADYLLNQCFLNFQVFLFLKNVFPPCHLDMGTTCSASRPVRGLKESCLTKPQSTTYLQQNGTKLVKTANNVWLIGDFKPRLLLERHSLVHLWIDPAESKKISQNLLLSNPWCNLRAVISVKVNTIAASILLV